MNKAALSALYCMSNAVYYLMDADKALYSQELADICTDICRIRAECEYCSTSPRVMFAEKQIMQRLVQQKYVTRLRALSLLLRPMIETIMDFDLQENK